MEDSSAEEILESRPPRLHPVEHWKALDLAGVPSFQAHLELAGLAPITADATTIFQVNVGKLCNQTCHHYHVDAGPD